VSYPGQARGRAVFTEAAGEPAGRPGLVPGPGAAQAAARDTTDALKAL